MTPPTVALVRCASYDLETVRAAVGRGLSLLGGPDRFVRPGESVLLKPNLLAADPPECAVTTHPSVFRAVAEALHACRLSFGDSPALSSPARAARRSGLTEAARAAGVAAADFREVRERTVASPDTLFRFPVAGPVEGADGIVSLPKLKTHDLLRYTGAVKNLFGCVPGLSKARFHLLRPGPADFARLLCELTRELAPRLHVMDAVDAMEGEGPRSGTPRRLGCLLLSADPVALDAVALSLVGIDPGFVPTQACGEATGLGCARLDRIVVKGDRPADLACPGFAATRRPPVDLSGRGVIAFLRRHGAPRPRVRSKACVRCGACVRICPAQPKAMVDPAPGRGLAPRVNPDRCIRCYCCREVCPAQAVGLKTPLLGRLLPG